LRDFVARGARFRVHLRAIVGARHRVPKEKKQQRLRRKSSRRHSDLLVALSVNEPHW
jgi:hypothetical protein